MPAVSPDRIEATMKLLLSGNFDMKMLTLCQRPISPPHDTPMRAFNNAGAQGAGGNFAKTTMQHADEMIGFFQLTADLSGAMTFRVKSPRELTTTSSREGFVPCWYLPWRSGHIIKLKIASLRDRPTINIGPGIDPVPNPDLFLTAAINGCSVFAIGDVQGPSMYHAGVDGSDAGGMNLGQNETTEQGWERLLAGARTRKTQGPERMGSVGKSDYVAELLPNATGNNDRYISGVKKTTAKAMELEEALRERKKLSITSVAPWGMVFGLRDKGGTWHVNLVRNATIYHERVTSRIEKLAAAVKGKATSVKNTVHDAFADKPAYNPHTVHASLVTAVNLGYQEFFPGKGAAHYRDLASVTVV